MTGPAPQLIGIPGGVQRAGRNPRPAGRGGWTGCAPTWILCGGRANGTAPRNCSPVICTATGPRLGRAGLRAARPRPGTTTDAATGAGGPAPAPGSAGRTTTPTHPGIPSARCCPSGVARCPVARASCTAPGCVSGTNTPGAARVRPSPWRTSPPWPARCRVPRTAWSPAAPESTSAAAGSAGSTTTVTCGPIRPHDPPWAGRVGGHGGTAARGAPVLPGRAARVWTVIDRADVGVVDVTDSGDVERPHRWCRWGRLVCGVTSRSSAW